MPYVTQEIRKELEHRPPDTVGELTYIIYKDAVENCDRGVDDGALWNKWLNICREFMRRPIYDYEFPHEPKTTPLGYARHAEVMGALACCAQELRRNGHKGFAVMDITCLANDFYRLETAPYEDEKRDENGDVP